MSFDYPLLLLLAPVVALLVGAIAFAAARRRLRAARAWSRELGRLAAVGRWRGPVLVGLAALCAAVGIAGPRWGRTQVTSRSESLNLVLAMDISRSMLAEDVRPSRLGRAKREAWRLVQDLGGDRVGLIAFAGRSYILTPLTVDQGAVRLYLDDLDPDLASAGGTDLSAVLRQGRELLSGTGELADRVLVLFTDGEGHDTLPDAVAAAKALREAGIKLVVVSEGGIVPVRIPLRDSSGTVVGYKLDENGAVVTTRREDASLRAIVDAADGTLVAADLPDQAGAVRDLLRTFRRSPSAETHTADLIPRAWMAVLAALVLLLLQTMLRRTAALIALAGLGLVPAAARAQLPSRAERTLEAGDPARAASEYLEQARTGQARDTAFYNAGTAALQARRLDVARGALGEAAKSLDPDLRYRALYNLGLVALMEAQGDSARRQALLDEAVQHLREALLLEPRSARAKWNLELAERRRPPPPSGGGGGGGGGGPPPPQGQQQPQGQNQPSPQALSQSQADQILNSMERQERETRADQVRRMQGGSGGGVKDW